jgi:Transglutaminase-like superfamily
MEWYENNTAGEKTVVRRITRFLKIFRSPSDVWLLIRIISWALFLPILKRIVPIKSLAKFLWSPSKKEKTPELEKKVAILVRWLYHFILPQKTCLERSLLLYHFLSKVNADPRLVTGMRRAEDHSWKGHAWILVGGKLFEESNASVEDFKTIAVFGPGGAMEQQP